MQRQSLEITSAQFLHAAREGNLAVVRAYIDANRNDPAKLNCRDVNDHTALIIAATLGYIDVVNALLAEDGIDINAKDFFDHTALIHAVTQGYTEIVNVLLAEDEIDVNAADDDGSTALTIAASNGYITMLEALLAKPGIEVNKPDGDKNSALHRAAYNGETASVIVLLRQPDIDLQARNYRGISALEGTLERGRVECATLIRKAIEERSHAEAKSTPSVPSFQERMEKVRAELKEEVEEPPEDYLCSVSRSLMEDPVTLAKTGFTYDRSSLKQWYEFKHGEQGRFSCPQTQVLVDGSELGNATNWLIKGQIERFVAAQEKRVHELKRSAQDRLSSPESKRVVDSSELGKPTDRLIRGQLEKFIAAQEKKTKKAKVVMERRRKKERAAEQQEMRAARMLRFGHFGQQEANKETSLPSHKRVEEEANGKAAKKRRKK